MPWLGNTDAGWRGAGGGRGRGGEGNKRACGVSSEVGRRRCVSDEISGNVDSVRRRLHSPRSPPPNNCRPGCPDRTRLRAHALAGLLLQLPCLSPHRCKCGGHGRACVSAWKWRGKGEDGEGDREIESEPSRTNTFHSNRSALGTPPSPTAVSRRASSQQNMQEGRQARLGPRSTPAASRLGGNYVCDTRVVDPLSQVPPCSVMSRCLAMLLRDVVQLRRVSPGRRCCQGRTMQTRRRAVK